jgi:hypothetical protein
MVVRARRGGWIRRLAPLALMPAAACAVHQLRYWLAFGGRATAELQVQGHAYLHSALPWVMVLVALWLGVFLRALGRALAGQSSVSRFTISFTALWLVCALCLVGIYACQEFLEGMFLAGHPAGLIGIFGYGGWWAIPGSLAVGLVLAAVFHGAGWVLHEVTELCRPPGRRIRAPMRQPGVPTGARLLRPVPLAGGWSGRGPPS